MQQHCSRVEARWSFNFAFAYCSSVNEMVKESKKKQCHSVARKPCEWGDTAIIKLSVDDCVHAKIGRTTLSMSLYLHSATMSADTNFVGF